MISALVLSVAMSTVAVPPNERVENHAHPAHNAQPTIRRYERYQEDHDRRVAWEAYTKEIDQLWQDYREAGSTPAAWRKYKLAAAEAKRQYVWQDLYLMPIVDQNPFGHN